MATIARDAKRLAKIRTSFIENVSVAGWKEAFDEDIKWIRRSYRYILLAFSICCVVLCFHIYQQWLDSGYKEDITDFFDQASIPFSNVTICAQIYLNRTFVRENAIIPDGFFRHYHLDTEEDLERFFDQLTIYLSMLVKVNTFTVLQLASFEKVIRATPAFMGDYREFSEKAMLPCESVVRRCSFDDRKFDCCQRSLRVLSADDGVCYLIPLNFDNDNAFPTGGTFRQSTAGPRGGLTIEASVDTSLSPWAENDESNGFTIFVNPIAFSAVQNPLIAPHGAETFIHVTPTFRRLTTDCAPHGKLVIDNSDPTITQFDYDPEGCACTMRDIVKMVKTFANCLLMQYTSVAIPNSTVICGPAMSYASGQLVKMDILKIFSQLLSSTGMSMDKIKQYRDAAEHIAQTLTSPHSRCPHHCEYWTYSSRSSFYELEKLPEPNTTMRSTVRIYYDDLSYRRYDQVPEYPSYLAFCDFGNLVALYLGMSIVSFFHVGYYVPRFLLVMWKAERKRKVAVGTSDIGGPCSVAAACEGNPSCAPRLSE